MTIAAMKRDPRQLVDLALKNLWAPMNLGRRRRLFVFGWFGLVLLVMRAFVLCFAVMLVVTMRLAAILLAVLAWGAISAGTSVSRRRAARVAARAARVSGELPSP